MVEIAKGFRSRRTLGHDVSTSKLNIFASLYYDLAYESPRDPLSSHYQASGTTAASRFGLINSTRLTSASIPASASIEW